MKQTNKKKHFFFSFAKKVNFFSFFCLSNLVLISSLVPVLHSSNYACIPKPLICGDTNEAFVECLREEAKNAEGEDWTETKTRNCSRFLEKVNQDSSLSCGLSCSSSTLAMQAKHRTKRLHSHRERIKEENDEGDEPTSRSVIGEFLKSALAALGGLPLVSIFFLSPLLSLSLSARPSDTHIQRNTAFFFFFSLSLSPSVYFSSIQRNNKRSHGPLLLLLPPLAPRLCRRRRARPLRLPGRERGALSLGPPDGDQRHPGLPAVRVVHPAGTGPSRRVRRRHAGDHQALLGVSGENDSEGKKRWGKKIEKTLSLTRKKKKSLPPPPLPKKQIRRRLCGRPEDDPRQHRSVLPAAGLKKSDETRFWVV